MITVGAYEAKTHLAHLLEQVAKGERVTITRHGVPVAVLVPANAATAMGTGEAVEALRQFRRGRTMSAQEIRQMISEGRR